MFFFSSITGCSIARLKFGNVLVLTINRPTTGATGHYKALFGNFCHIFLSRTKYFQILPPPPFFFFLMKLQKFIFDVSKWPLLFINLKNGSIVTFLDTHIICIQLKMIQISSCFSNYNWFSRTDTGIISFVLGRWSYMYLGNRLQFLFAWSRPSWNSEGGHPLITLWIGWFLIFFP